MEFMENQEFIGFPQISLQTYVVAGLQKHQLFQWNIIGSGATLGPCSPQNGEISILSRFPPQMRYLTKKLCFPTA